MYTLELNLRYSPFPIAIQKKEYDEVLQIFNQIKSAMADNHNSSLIELKCEKVKDKLIAVVSREITSIQIYEKSAVVGGSKRPGFAVDL